MTSCPPPPIYGIPNLSSSPVPHRRISSPTSHCDKSRSRVIQNFSDFYSLVEHIGAGGYGSVWSCIEKETGLKRAVKIVSDKKCWRKTYCDRYKMKVPDEAALWQPLSHPNIVSLVEVFYSAEKHYWMYVMEYEEQYVDMFNYIESEGPLCSSRAAFVTRQVIAAMHYMIASGVDHRDIKDENILIDPHTFHCRLVDFGSASVLKPDPYVQFRGTEVYLPPEYYKHQQYEAFPAAVWSIGCLVHCLIAGDCPFDHKSEVADYERLHWLDEEDVLAKSFIDQSMAVDPARRLKIATLLQHPWFNEPEPSPEYPRESGKVTSTV